MRAKKPRSVAVHEMRGFLRCWLGGCSRRERKPYFSTPYVAINADSVIAVSSFQRRSTAVRIAKKSIDGACAPPISSMYSIGVAGTLFAMALLLLPFVAATSSSRSARRQADRVLNVNYRSSWHITPAETSQWNIKTAASPPPKELYAQFPYQ